MLRKRTLLKSASMPDINTRLLLHLDGSVSDASSYNVPVSTYGGTFVTGKFGQGFYGGYPTSNSNFPIGIGNNLMTTAMSGTFTAEMWFNWDTLDTTTYGAAYLMYFGVDMVTPGYSNWFIAIGPSSGGATPTRTLSFQQVIDGIATVYFTKTLYDSDYAGDWCHLAVTRDINNRARVYLNGVDIVGGTVLTMNNPTGGSGSPVYGAYTLLGMGGTHIDEIRISDNVRWSSNFTRPTSAYS